VWGLANSKVIKGALRERQMLVLEAPVCNNLDTTNATEQDFLYLSEALRRSSDEINNWEGVPCNGCPATT